MMGAATTRNKQLMASVIAVLSAISLGKLRNLPASHRRRPRLALVPGAVVLMAREGPSDVDASDPRRFRTIFLAGKPGLSVSRLLTEEIKAQQQRGWTRVPQSAASLRSAGLVVILDAPRANTYASMDAIRGMDDIVDDVGDSPDRRIVQRIKDAFRRGRPLLLVVLGPRKSGRRRLDSHASGHARSAAADSRTPDQADRFWSFADGSHELLAAASATKDHEAEVGKQVRSRTSWGRGDQRVLSPACSPSRCGSSHVSHAAAP